MKQALSRFLKIALAILALTLVGGWGYLFYVNNIRVVPEELVSKALEQVSSWKSYRFRLEAFIETEGGRRVEISSIQGERSSGGDFHLWGRMTGQDVDIYQVGDTTYFREPVSQKWMVTPGNNPLQQDIFLLETDPLSILRITEVKDLDYKGKQKDRPGRPHLFELRPEINNNLLNAYWKDFECKLWIDRKNLNIDRAEMVATHRQKAGYRLWVILELEDLNRQINIKPPVT